jgi:hypothetical protein
MAGSENRFAPAPPAPKAVTNAPPAPTAVTNAPPAPKAVTNAPVAKAAVKSDSECLSDELKHKLDLRRYALLADHDYETTPLAPPVNKVELKQAPPVN